MMKAKLILAAVFIFIFLFSTNVVDVSAQTKRRRAPKVRPFRFDSFRLNLSDH